MSEVHNIWLFFYAIAKVLAMTGLGLAAAIAVIAECCDLRIVALGVEQVSAARQLAKTNRERFKSSSATSLPRKDLARIA